MRILYVHSTQVPPPTDLSADRFAWLSDGLEGDVLQPIWFRTAEEVEAHFGPGSYPVYTVGKFRYHWFLLPERNMAGRMGMFWFYVSKGRELHRSRPFDCIIAYSHQTTGLLAGIVKLLTGARLIIEIVSTPQLAYISDRPHPGILDRARRLYSDICLHLSAWLADRCHFLYPNQLGYFSLLRNVPNSVFHEFVPVSAIERNTGDAGEPYILLVGAPWYLKGADVLIKAFSEIAPEFPGLKLKLLGYYPGQEQLLSLTEGSPQIEVIRACPNPQALEIIKRATIMATPSRSEGLPRVIMEGMAAGVPVVASRVGGIPVLVRDGENGYTVPIGDHHMLAVRLRELLLDEPLRRRMGNAGYARAHDELNEQSYVREFTRMVAATVGVKPTVKVKQESAPK